MRVPSCCDKNRFGSLEVKASNATHYIDYTKLAWVLSTAIDNICCEHLECQGHFISYLYEVLRE